MMKAVACARALLTGVCLVALPAFAEDRIEFDSAMYGTETAIQPNFQLLGAFSADNRTKDVRITATLNIPEDAKGPVAAIVIDHTSGGVGADVSLLEQAMRRAGFATLIYESFVPRNYPRSGDGSGGTKLELNQVVDAYMALKALAANPRIDPKRIYYVGMSAEGNAALLATIEWIRKRYADNLQFAGLVALYPGGYAAPNAAGMSTETPLLILPAEQDNFMKWSRTKVWLDYVTRENPSLPIKVVMVRDTQHSFMHPNGAGYNPNTATPNNCPYLLVSERAPMAPMLQLDGSVVGYRWDQSCVARGATTSYSSSAAAFAIAQIVAFSNGEAARQDSLRSTLLKGKKAV